MSSLIIMAIFLAGCASGPASRSYSGDELVERDLTILTQTEVMSDPRADVIYQLLVAEMAGKRGQSEIAKAHYARAAKLTDDVEVLERAMRIAIYAEDWPLALETTHRWAQQQGFNSENRQVLGLLYLRTGDVDAAEEQFLALVKQAQTSANNVYSLIANTLRQVDEKERSLILMDRLVANDFTNAKAHYFYADLAMRAEQFQLAIDQAELAIGFDPNLTAAKTLRVQGLSKVGESEMAFAEMAEMVADDAENFALRLAYAQLLLGDERYSDAIKQLHVLLERRADDSELLYTTALAHLQIQESAAAKKYLQQLVATNQRLDEAHYYLARIAEQEDDLETAIEYFSRVAYGDLFLESMIRLTDLYAETEGIKSAQEHISLVRKNTRNLPDIIRLYMAEAGLLYNRADYQSAYEVYSEGLREYPQHPDLLYARALVAEKLGRLDRLEADLKNLLEMDPQNANALNALGFTLADHNLRLDEARSFIERAYALSSDDPAIIDSMGWVNYRIGRLSEAENYLRKAFKLMPEAEIIGHLVEVLWAQQQQVQARELLEQGLQEFPADDYLLRLQQSYP
ncbi:MAG: tetratricopeptide repeat protein [Gammaproteobacteria bacterium]|nr:tetratricopeptide repeat protein [Gammaproteobacteria bacterium]